MIPLEKYACSRNWCCLGYFGPDRNTVDALLAAKDVIERMLPGLGVYISCRPEFASTYDRSDIIPSTELKQRRHDFAYFEELRSDGRSCPVQILLDGIRSDKSRLQKLDIGSR